MTEIELVVRCRQGDREAQRELYAQTSERVYRLLVRMTGSTDTAFDLAQDTYLRAFNRIAQFDGRSAVATWLCRIAVTTALQFLRRERRFLARLKESNPEAAMSGCAEQSAVRLDVNEALETLEPTDRALLLLRYQEGLDYRAIGAILECAEGTVASGLHRARERLRAVLSESYAPGEEIQGARHQRNGTIRPAGSHPVAGERGPERARRK